MQEVNPLVRRESGDLRARTQKELACPLVAGMSGEWRYAHPGVFIRQYCSE